MCLQEYQKRSDAIIKKVQDSVFRVQKYQRDHQWKDCSELIALASSKFSEEAVIAAQVAAVSDMFSSFKGTWSQRHIPTIEEKPIASTVHEARAVPVSSNRNLLLKKAKSSTALLGPSKSNSRSSRRHKAGAAKSPKSPTSSQRS